MKTNLFIYYVLGPIIAIAILSIYAYYMPVDKTMTDAITFLSVITAVSLGAACVSNLITLLVGKFLPFPIGYWLKNHGVSMISVTTLILTVNCFFLEIYWLSVVCLLISLLTGKTAGEYFKEPKPWWVILYVFAAMGIVLAGVIIVGVVNMV